MAGDLGKNWDDATKKAKLYSDAIEASNKKAEKHSQFLSSIAEEMGIAYGSFKKQVEKTLEQRREEERILSNISLKSKEINREISKGNNEILKANEIQIKRISLEDVYAQKNIDTNRTFEDFNKTLNEALKIEKEKGKLTDEQSKALDFQKEILKEQDLINNNNSNNLKESIKSNEILKTVLESQGVDIENNSDLQEGLNKLSNDALYGVQGQLKAIANIEEKKRIGLELSEDELDVYKELKPLQGALEEKEKNIVKIKKEEERAQENVNQKMRDAIGLSGDWTKGIAKDMWGAMKAFDKAVSDAGKNFGFIQDHSWGTSAQMSVLNSEAARFNMSSEDTMNMMGQLGDELKTIDQRHLANSVKHFIAIEKATGISSEEIATIAGEMMRAGKSAEDVENYMEGANHTAKMFGVNTKKVLQGVARNIDKMRQMGFKGGEESLTRMVATAERLRINVDEIFDVAKKARTIEGAMDMAAELQLAGGSFANIDPMSLLAAARKGPEELQKILTQMGGDIGRFNDEGVFEIDAIDADRLQMVADSTGMSVDSLTKMIQKNAEDSKKLNMFQGTLDGLEEADKALVGSGISDMLKIGKDGSVEFDVDSNMAKKMGINSLEELQSMSAEDIKKKIEADAKTLEEQAEQNQSFEDSLKGLKDAFYNIFTIFEPFLRKITEFVQFLNGSVVGKWVLATLALGAFMPKMIKSFGEFKQGASSLVESFKGMSEGKGFLGKVKGFFSGAKPKDDGSLNGADSKDMTPSKSGGGLKSLAQGLAKMGGKNVLKGIGNTALAGPALALMLPGMPTLGLMIAIGAGGALLEFGFKSLASGIASFGNKKNILKGIGAIALAGPALLIASPGIIAISLASILSGGGLLLTPLFQSLSTGLSILGKNFTNVAKGSIALILVGSAMIPFAVAAKIMTDVDWVSVLTGVGVMSLVVLGLMGLGALLMGPQILALLVGVGTLIAVGAAMLVASIGLLSAATAFEKLAEINWDGLSNMGSALMSTVPGLLAFSLASMMFLNPLSLLGMIAMTATLGGLAVVMIPLGDAMIKAADGMERFAGGLEKLQQAASNLDFERLEALKDLSMGMAVAGVGGGVLGDQIKKIAEALAMLSNSNGGGSGGGTKKFEINLKLNGRQLQEIIIDDTEIVS